MRIIVCLLMMLLLFLTACAGEVTITETVPVLKMETRTQTVTAKITLTTTVTQDMMDEIILDEGGIIITSLFVSSSFVSFYGLALLPDGTLLLSQLYQDGKPLSWWPSDEAFEVKDRSLVIRTGLNIDGTQYEMKEGHSYRLEVWQEDKPEVATNRIFIFEGENIYWIPGPPPTIK